MKYIVTFGYGQIPGIGFYTTVEAENEGEARRIVHEAISTKWSLMYKSKEAAGVYEYNLTYMPLGQVAEWVNTAFENYNR